MASSVAPRAFRPVRRLIATRPFLSRNSYGRSSPLHTSAVLHKSHDKTHGKTKAGSSARTDESITVEYPSEQTLPSSRPVAGTGRAGDQVYPTLASLSLHGKVGVVTGGARGLGLVMGQGMVVSGSDLAIVDLNSLFCLSPISPPHVPLLIARTEDEAAKQAGLIVETFKKENPGAERFVFL
jgi:D-arabinitol 2-dehydrogenase